MLCPNCGASLADGSRFCPYCDSKFDEPAKQDASPDREAYDQNLDLTPVSSCSSDAPSDFHPDPMHDPRGMKWFKFIIYFQLFANAAANGYSALTALIGTQYQGKADFVYRGFPALRAVDLAYCLVLLALAAFAVFTRMRLARFRRNAPLLYYILSIANTLDAVLYVLLVSLVSGVPVGDMVSLNLTMAVAANLMMLVVNIIYFGKRKDLFVN